jgi:chemotaxis protein MotA
MLFPIGVFIVFGSVIGGYMMHHGKLSVLWQPNEVVIIVGSNIGAFLIANPPALIKKTLGSLKYLMKGAPFKKEHYIELLSMMFTVLKTMKTKGMLELESHIENPHESSIFNAYPTFVHNHHAVDFFCDYLRVMTLGVEDAMTVEDIMDKELDTMEKEGHEPSHALTTMAEAFPALGIVAAVLGVITTMGSIMEPPEILGGLIGAALVGTFLGVLLCYGIFGPMASFLGKYSYAEEKYLHVIKMGLLSHMKGNAPTVSVEFARKMIMTDVRPSFKEVEDALANATAK